MFSENGIIGGSSTQIRIDRKIGSGQPLWTKNQRVSLSYQKINGFSEWLPNIV